MKHNLKYMRFLILGVIICFTCFLLTCQNKQKTKMSLLTVVCDSTFAGKIFWDAYLIANKDTLKMNYKNTNYDTVTKTVTIVWDSLANGEYYFETISIFQQKNKTSIILKHDTTVHIKSSYKYEFVDSISQEELLKADTIAFVLQAHGCSFHIAGYRLIRDGDKYQLHGLKRKGADYERINKYVSPEIINDLYKVQVLCQNFPLGKRWSTMSYQFILSHREKVFYFNDEYSVSSELYKPLYQYI